MRVSPAAVVLLVVCVACSDRRKPEPAPAQPPRDAAGTATATADASPDAMERFVVTERVESHGTFLEVKPRDADCPSLSWEVGRRTLRFGLCAKTPIPEQVAPLREMLVQLRGRTAEVDDARFTFTADWYTYPEHVKRLATYAQANPFVPRGTETGLPSYILDAASKQDLFPELTELFAGISRRPVLRGVEKCSFVDAAKARDELGDWLRAEKLTGKAVPVGCLIAFFELQ